MAKKIKYNGTNVSEYVSSGNVWRYLLQEELTSVSGPGSNETNRGDLNG